MKFSSVVLFAAGAYAAADWNAIARAVTPVSQISDGQVQAPTGTPYPAGNATVVAPTGTAVGTVAPSGGVKPSGTGSSPSQVTTNAADSLNLPYVGAGLVGIAALLAL